MFINYFHFFDHKNKYFSVKIKKYDNYVKLQNNSVTYFLILKITFFLYW